MKFKYLARKPTQKLFQLTSLDFIRFDGDDSFKYDLKSKKYQAVKQPKSIKTNKLWLGNSP